MEPHAPPLIRAGLSPDGTRTFLVGLPAESLPPVRRRDLENAWDIARDAAAEEAWGPPLLVRFVRSDGETTDLALADRDACCWAAAVDRVLGLHTVQGLAVCLRLLALVDLLALARWTDRLCRIGRDGATLHPALVQEAAHAPLTSGARFDETALRARLDRPALAAPQAGAFA